MTAVGEFALARVVESEEPLFQPSVFLPESTADVFEQHRGWLQPRHVDPATGELILCVQSYVVRTPRHTILVDACVGNDKERAAHRPSWHKRNWPYLDNLARVGVRPEEVDIVMCTHLHIDHVGWNTRLLDGRWVPTFPNAKYVFARREVEFWETRLRAGESSGHTDAFVDSVQPVLEAKQAVLVEMDHQIEDGVWLEPAPGHTAGNVVVHLRSGGAHAVLSGDVIHHPVQLVRPDWSSRACEDREASRRTRRRLLEQVADTDTLLAPAHFASPSICRIVGVDDRFGLRD